MNTPPTHDTVEDSMEKGDTRVRHVVNTYLDAETLQPIRPDGITDEQFKKSLPDNKIQRFLQYLRGIKDRKQAKDRIIPTSECKEGTSMAWTHTDASPVELYPEGYPQLAAVIDSDEQFMLYRRFGHLQARLLLNKQDELRELEFRLSHIDSVYARRWPARLRSRDICNAESDDHKGVLALIEEKYKEYGESCLMVDEKTELIIVPLL